MEKEKVVGKSEKTSEVKPQEVIGRDVVLIIRVGRHAHKAEAGAKADLSPRGEDASREEGAGLGTLSDERFGLKSYNSGVPRAKRTAELILESASSVKFQKLNPQRRVELSFKGLEDFPKEGWGSFQGPWIKEHYPHYSSSNPSDKERVIQESEDFSTGLALQSPRFVEDAAGRLSTLLLRHISMAGRLKNGSRVILDERGHEPMFTSFFSRCLTAYNPQTGETRRGFRTVEEFGGAFKPLESFEIDIARDRDGREKVNPRFNNPERMKGWECTLDFKEMSRLREEYIKRHRGK
jgi:hypothetical protein